MVLAVSSAKSGLADLLTSFKEPYLLLMSDCFLMILPAVEDMTEAFVKEGGFYKD